MGGNIRPTREGSVPLGLLEKGDKVANLVDPYLMRKRLEHATVARGHRIEPRKDLGVLVLDFPHLKPTATSWTGRGVLELAFPHLKPTATTWSGRGGGEHVRLRE